MQISVHKALQKGRPTAHYDDGERVITWVLTTGTGDRDGETVNPAGGNFEEFAMNPVVMYNHNTDAIGLDAFPIGRVLGEPWLEQIGEGTQYPEVPGPARDALLGKVKFSQENPQGDLAYRMAKEGMLVGGSISFLPEGEVSKNDTGGNHYDNWKLLEFTICPVGSNPDAVKLSKGLLTVRGESMRTKSVRWTSSSYGGYTIDEMSGGVWRVSYNGNPVEAFPHKAQAIAFVNDKLPSGVPHMPLDTIRRSLKYYRKNKTAWVLKTGDGSPLDKEMEEYLEQRGLDEVRVEDEAPPEGEEWVEEEVQMPEEKATVRERDVYEAGADASDDNRPASDNPYTGKDERLAQYWDDGWHSRAIKSRKDVDTQDEDIVERCGAAMCKEGYDSDMVELAVKRLKKSLAAKRNKSAPPGHQAASKLMKAIEDELPLVEQPKIRDAMENALKQLRRARSIAYKDLESMDDAIAGADGNGELEQLEDEIDAENPTLTEGEESAKRVKVSKSGTQEYRVYTNGKNYDYTLDEIVRSYRLSNEGRARLERMSVGETLNMLGKDFARTKKLTKSDRALVKAAMDYLDEASNNSPQYLAAGMKHHAAQLKALTEEPAPEMTEADLTDEDKEQMDEALKRLKSLQSRFDNAVFAATGL